jgi:hypothetical protein
MGETELRRKEKMLEKKEGRLMSLENAEIKESEKLLGDMKALFLQEAEYLSNPGFSLASKCQHGSKMIEQQNSLLSKISDDSKIISRLADKSNRIFREEEIDASLISRAKQNNPALAADAHRLLEATKLESVIEKLSFLIEYDIGLFREDQKLRNKMYLSFMKSNILKATEADFIHTIFQMLLKDSKHLNEILRYLVGEENVEKYAIMIEEKFDEDLKL